MKKLLAVILFSVSTLCGFAQYDSNLVHKGILAGVGTVSVSEMPALNISNVYVTGNLEYYAQKNVSIRGDAYVFVNTLTTGSNLIKGNDIIYFGAFYHFPTHSGFDPLIGFQPGISYTKVFAGMGIQSGSSGGISGALYPIYDEVLCPQGSIVIGFNYFAEKLFHIQANVRYSIGSFTAGGTQDGMAAEQFNISELSFNFGLGININTIPQHTKHYREPLDKAVF